MITSAHAKFWVGVIFFGSLVLTLIGLVLRHDALFWISFITLALVALVFIGSVLGKILDSREKRKSEKVNLKRGEQRMITNAEAITNYLENENVFSPTLDNERLALEILDILSINPSEKLENERWASALYSISPSVR